MNRCQSCYAQAHTQQTVQAKATEQVLFPELLHGIFLVVLLQDLMTTGSQSFGSMMLIKQKISHDL